jgi:hypothetical protein
MHINRFLDRLRAAESRKQRDLHMSVADARDLHTDITRLLMRLEELQKIPQEPDTVTVIMEGGKF